MDNHSTNPLPIQCHCTTTQPNDYTSSIPNYQWKPTPAIHCQSSAIWLPLYNYSAKGLSIKYTWLPQDSHMTTTVRHLNHWTTTSMSLDYHLSSTWLPLDDHLTATWLPLYYHLTATWIPLDYHLTATWLPLDYHLTSTWWPLDYHLTTTWLPLDIVVTDANHSDQSAVTQIKIQIDCHFANSFPLCHSV